jgi:hypothetical protein
MWRLLLFGLFLLVSLERLVVFITDLHRQDIASSPSNIPFFGGGRGYRNDLSWIVFSKPAAAVKDYKLSEAANPPKIKFIETGK